MVESLIVLNIFIAGVAIGLGFFLLLGKGRNRQKVLFALLSILAAIWIPSNYFGNPDHYALVVTDYVSGTLLVLFFWLFSVETRAKALGAPYRNRNNLKSLQAIVAYIATAVVIGLILTGFVVSVGIDPSSGTKIYVNKQLYAVYPLLVLVLGGTSIYDLIKAYIKSRDSLQKTRVKLMLAGLTIAFICIAVPNLVLENILPEKSALLIFAYNGSYIGIFAFLTLSTYAIVKHGLFDIKLAAVRGVVYGGVLVTLSLIYYAAAYLASFLIIGNHMTTDISISPFNMLLALALAFLFQPIKRFFDKVTNDIFYRNAYSSETFFAELGTILTSTTDLRGLLESTSQEIAQALKAEQVFFRLTYTNGTEHHIAAGTRHHSNIAAYDVHMLNNYVHAMDNEVLVGDLMSERDENVRRMLRSHKIALVVPLAIGKERIGYLLLGDHRSGSYTKRDIKTLTAMRNELVIAIQNALSLHEVKELNATLQQRIDVATKELRSSNAQLKHLDEVKDEFMSMASHQLRTPLTSIKGYLSMVIDGDVGKVTPQQEKLLQEAFHSSERMVHLIADFLNVSRLQTGKFVVEKAEMDINELVRGEVEELKVMATGRNMKLHFDAPTGPLYVHADAGKLREVIMNFVDNAIYYSKTESTIDIKLADDADSITFTVVDAGIGVPKEEQSRLFGKFFRATNARKQRPDGTGVGLYLARKVIAAHHGSIIFASQEGKGSTFGFRLPRSKVAAKS